MHNSSLFASRLGLWALLVLVIACAYWGATLIAAFALLVLLLAFGASLWSRSVLAKTSVSIGDGQTACHAGDTLPLSLTVHSRSIFPLIWLCTLLLPQNLPRWGAQLCYTLMCTLFGLLFGVLYAPWQAILFGLSFEKTLAWIAAGFAFDVTHALGNFAASFLIFPILNLLRKINQSKSAVG